LALKKLDSENEKFPVAAYKKRESLKGLSPEDIKKLQGKK